MKTVAALASTALILTTATFAAPFDFPPPKVDLPPSRELTTAVFAGGCFWGVELVFEHVKGVQSVRSGYAGGKSYMAHYAAVSGGDTGHAESVEILYDPQRISYGELLRVFFAVAHDPTELNRQGPDEGTQYRSTIFFKTPEEQRVVSDYIAQLDGARLFDAKIVTTLEPNLGFYPAEPEHQDYATRHPNQPYIRLNDRPKLARLQRFFPELYRE